MMRNNNKHAQDSGTAILSWLSLLVTASLPATTYAATEMLLEEVVVTARKREESLQETPVAVSAFSERQMAQEGITNLADFNQIVPNMEVQRGNGPGGAANIFIRGVGQRNTGVNVDSGVGIYLDGVYLGRPDGALLDINDMQSVQVLRGPQGTLFGKNTTGGALVFTTNKPGEDFEGTALIRGGNYDRLDADLAINIPLVEDKLFTRLSLGSRRRDGYMENISDGRFYNDEDRLNALWQLRWLAGESVTADLNVNWAKTNQRSRLQKCQLAPVPGSGWRTDSVNPIIEAATGKTGEQHCLESQNLDTYEGMGDLGGKYTAETTGVGLTVNWDINASLSFKSITAWRATEAGVDNDLDALAIQYQQQTAFEHPAAQLRDTDQYSQEFQLTGDSFDSSVQYVTGLYFYKEKSPTQQTVGFSGGPWQSGPPATPIPGTLFISNTANIETDNTSASAFGQVDWEFASAWRLTLGARYTWEERKLERNAFIIDETTLTKDGSVPAQVSGFWIGLSPDNINPNFGFKPDPDPALAYQQGKVTDSAWTPMASIQYLFGGSGWVSAGTAYFTASQGFLSGGLSEFNAAPFDPEWVTNFELGLKLDAWGSRLRFNTALFHADYRDRQLTTVGVTDDGRIGGKTINAAESYIQGIEFETTLLPVNNLELTFNAAFNRGEIEEFTDVQIRSGDGSAPGCRPISVAGAEECVIDRSDENLPRLPTRTFFLAAQYFWNTDVGTFIPRIQGSWKYDLEMCFDRSSCESGLWNTNQKDVSARFSWLSTDERWMAALFGNNLSGEEHLIGGQPIVDSQGWGGVILNPPTMYGAELSYRW